MYTLDFIRYQENRFDSFCKTVIRNASLDSIRSRKKREALFSSLDDLQSDLYLQEISQDRYATYSKRYRGKGIDVTIENEEIGEALQYIYRINVLFCCSAFLRNIQIWRFQDSCLSAIKL